MGPALTLSTDSHINRKPLLLAKLLATLSPGQAAALFGSQLAKQQQLAVLQAVPHRQAAELLLGLPAAAQRELLLGMLPAAAAGLLHWLMPAEALQLMLGGRSGTDGAAPASEGGSRGGSGANWVGEVLDRLEDRHLGAMLAAAQPSEVAHLLKQSSDALCQRVLGLLPQSSRAAALAVAHLRQAAAARRREAEAGAPGDAQSGQNPTTPESPAQAGLPAAPGLDPGCALLAFFQRLTAAEKTSLLLMGSAEAASLLLPLLGDEEAQGVLLLLPKQRQEQLLQLQHPAEERRMRGLALQASQRKSSLLLPQQLAAAAAAGAPDAGPEGRRTSLAPHQLAMAAAAAAAGSTERGKRGRVSFLASHQLAEVPAAATPAGSVSPLRSGIFTAAKGPQRRGSLSVASPRAAGAAAAAGLQGHVPG